MDKKSKMLVLIFLCLIIASIFLLYKRSFVKYDFEIIQEEIITDSPTEDIE